MDKREKSLLNGNDFFSPPFFFFKQANQPLLCFVHSLQVRGTPLPPPTTTLTPERIALNNARGQR